MEQNVPVVLEAEVGQAACGAYDTRLFGRDAWPSLPGQGETRAARPGPESGLCRLLWQHQRLERQERLQVVP